MDSREIASKLEAFSSRLGRKLTKRKGKLKERYTITGDIISYSICPRQYGFYKFYGFAPSNPTQEWFGSVIHRFLKRIHTLYKKSGRLISPGEVEEHFLKVELSMEAEGARPSSPQAREKAIEILKTFISTLGPTFIPSVVEAEIRLVKELPHYILYGIVDALKSAGGELEIWDYKGMERPIPETPLGRKKLEIYRKQMFVYGYLFKERNGKYPRKAVLFFMNELLKGGECYLEVDFGRREVQREVEEFIEEFSKIVLEIEECKKSGEWRLPAQVDERTCRQCDFRWDCPKFL